MRRFIGIALCLGCLPANAAADIKGERLKELLSVPCAVDVDISEMHDHDSDVMPTVIRALLPASMHYQQISASVFRVDGHGTECGDYVGEWFREPKSFEGLMIKKVSKPEETP